MILKIQIICHFYQKLCCPSHTLMNLGGFHEKVISKAGSDFQNEV